MNLLQVGVKLKAENIQSFIDDFLKVEGVNVTDIRLYDGMILINKIKYKSFGTLSLGLGIDRVEDGVVSISIRKIRAINIPISLVPVNLILKVVLSKVNVSGITWDESKIKVNLPIIFNEFGLDFLNLNIKDIHITEESINLLVDNVDLNMKKLINGSKSKTNPKVLHSKNLNEFQSMESTPLLAEEIPSLDFKQEFFYENSTEDTKCSEENFYGEKYFPQYSRFRERVYNGKFKENEREFLGKIVFLLPDIGVLAYRLLRDRRIRKTEKILIGFTLAYVLNPFDKVNKKFPILSKLDDGLLIIFTLTKIFTGIDRSIISHHFDGSEDTLNFLIDGFDVLSQFMGLDRVNRLYAVFEKFIR